jgi:uncharacterized membrane protein (UPF0127 family)
MLTDYRLVERASGRVVVERLELADRFWSRLVGLQFRGGLPSGQALLLIPCGSVHTCWLRFPIDIAALDRQGRVLSVRRAVAPWRAVLLPRGAWAVLESSAHSLQLAEGDHVAAESSTPEASLPNSLQFLQSEQ